MNTRRRPLIPCSVPASRTLLAGATALGVFGLSACGGGTAASGDGDGVRVVASFYPMQFLAEEIGGEHVSVSVLTRPGVEPHDLELKPRQAAELDEADLVVYLKGLQPSVDRAVEQSGAANIAEATSYTGLDPYGGHGHGDHDHGPDDPHVWLDPVRYSEVAEGVGKALAKADPEHAADYRKNAGELVSKLNALDADFREGLKNRRTDTFITTHAAFGYLAGRYGLHEEAITGLNPSAEPSGARMRQLHRVAEKDGVDTVFFEASASDRTARALADDLGLRTDVLDPLEGVTEKSRGDDYFEIMRANLRALQKALGAQ
ncbi:MAG TPA: metal ABC transporter substrate-binding protein [Streptomyces sp.]|nr:metal ABC transporter substrate-binding protein [Streptomyces sp.]